MQRSFALLILLSLLLLAACSDTVPGVTAPDAAGFRFDIDPSSQEVTVTAVGLDTLSTQQTGGARLLEPGTELALRVERFSFFGSNVVEIEAVFENVTAETSFSQPFSFRRVLTPQQGNYLSSTEPEVSDEALGGNGVLLPGGRTASLFFRVTTKGGRFSYFVNAYAVVKQRSAEGCDADGVFQGDAIISTQEYLDALEGCRVIDGSLVIDTDAQTLDFSPLDSLRTVTGAFVVENNPALTSVSGFNNLREVATSPDELSRFSPEFAIKRNASLVSISGFRRLNQVGGGGFSILSNGSLVSIEGFGRLRSTNDFNISFNDSLISMGGFGQLRSTNGFRIRYNDSLVSFSGFGSLREVNGNFIIQYNASLVSFSGFGKLRSIVSEACCTPVSFIIEYNNSLVSFSGFEQLRFVGNPIPSGAGRFDISYNPSLVSIPGFGKLEAVLGDGFSSTFTITGNISLISISGFEKLNRIEGEGFGVLFIFDNDSLTSISGFTSLTSVESSIGYNSVFDCSIPPQNNLPFLPVNESVENLVNCPTKRPRGP